VNSVIEKTFCIENTFYIENKFYLSQANSLGLFSQFHIMVFLSVFFSVFLSVSISRSGIRPRASTNFQKSVPKYIQSLSVGSKVPVCL
jgi:hypothetical protein